MTNANTADNATLKIGSETAKPLWYNDERASSSNSWEATEIISVFFDGANYRASNSQGGSNKKTAAYLLGDLRTLAVGQTYIANENVKTSDKQFVRMSKDINVLNLTDEVATGDLKAFNNLTYQALVPVEKYNANKVGGYSDGDCAIGSPAKLSLKISRAYTDGTITITFDDAEYEVPALAADSVSDIVNSAVTVLSSTGEWVFTNNNGVLTATSIAHGDFSDTIFSLIGGIGTGVVGIAGEPVPGTPDTDEEANDGTSTVLTMTLTKGVGTVDITFGEETKTISVTDTDNASNIVTSIVGETWSSWNVEVDSLDTETAVISAVLYGVHAVEEISVAENIQGISGVPTLVTQGTTVLKVYNKSEDAWTNVTISQYAANSAVWQSLSITDLISAVFKQNTINNHIEYTAENYIGNYDEDKAISVPLTTNRTYAITNGVLGIGSNSSSYKGATNPIDVTPYSKMYLKFYLSNSHTSVSAFTDANNTVVGGKILNTTRDFIEVEVPYGATKLYLSTHKDHISTISAIGVIKKEVKDVTDDLYDKLNSLKESGEKLVEIPLTQGNVNYRILQSTNKFGSDKTDKHIFVPVVGNAVYKIIGNSIRSFDYSWTIDKTEGFLGTPHYCSGITGVSSRGANTTTFITAPSDAKFLYLSTAFSGTNSRPSYLARFYDLTERLEIIEDNVDAVKECVTEIDISESVYPPINYRMIASRGGEFTSSTGTTDKHINVPVIGGATYRMTCPTTQICGFVTDAMIGTAFGKMPHFCAGTTVMSLAAGTVDIKAPLDARFLTLTVRQNGDANNLRRPTFFARVEKGLAQSAENTKAIMEGVKSSDALIFDYYGEKLNLHNKYGLMAVASCYASSLQSTACYGDYTISVNKGVTEMQMRKNTGPLTLTTSLPSKGSTDIYHGNQCNFGTQKYDENDFFPVLYVACNNDSNNRCFELVYRIVTTVNEETGEFSSFSAVLVQTIYLPAMTDENSLGNCNIVIDRQRNYMYTYSRNNRVGASNQGIGIITRYSKIPPLFDANLEPITEVYFEDTSAQNPDYYIAEQFDPGMGRIVNGQGGDILNGKLYIVRGGYGVGYTYLYCIDLLQRRLVTLIDLYKVQVAKQQQFNDDNWTFEPEGLYIWKEDLYITTNMSTTVKVLT